jgi:glycosyltransferase involved in cell wall biosynthesis
MSGPRLLLSVHSADRGGAEVMALREARYLRRRFDLVVAVPDDGPLQAEFAAEVPVVRGSASMPLWGAPALTWAKRVARTGRDSVRLARVIRDRRIAAVITNSAVSLAPVLAARYTRVPAIVHVRDVPVSRLARAVFAAHALLADTLIIIADDMAGQFPRRRRARIVKVPEGVDVPPPPAPPANGFGSPVRLCLVGALDRRKGQDIAVEALALLRDREVDATLELVGRVGQEDFAAELRERVRALGLDGRVVFRGEVPTPDDALAGADIVVAPSRGEWTPLVLMEAALRLKPVVAAAVGGVDEVVLDHRTGLTVPPGDPAALARSVEQLRGDPASARDMAARGRDHVAEHFSLERSLQALEHEITGAIARARR